MDDVIFSGFGRDIVKRDGKYFIRYDGGHFAHEVMEEEITPEEAVKAQKSSKDGLEVIHACKRRRKEQK